MPQDKFTTSDKQKTRFQRRKELRDREKWIVDPIFPAGSMHLIGGASGVGKSTLMFQWLNQWDKGQNILGGESFRCPWVYVSGDRGTLDTDKTLRRMGLTDWDIPCYSWEEVSAKDEPNLIHVAEVFPHAELIVVEGLQAFIPESPKQTQNKATLMWMIDVRRQILNKGKTIIATVHAPKQSYENNRNNFLGSASLAGATSTLISVTPPANSHTTGINRNVREVTIGGRNFADMHLTFELDGNGLFVPLAEALEAPHDPDEGKPAGDGSPSYIAMDESIVVIPMGVKVPLDHFKQTAKHLNVGMSTMHRWLALRVDQGVVAKVGRGLYERPTAQ